MEQIRLGRTGLMVSQSGFGAIPIQRLSNADAEALLRRAFEGGINFFDTARLYSDSEEKMGRTFSGMRDKIIIASKSVAQTAEGLFADLETSLSSLKTDWIDIYQLHNPDFMPDESHELYTAALKAKQQGKIRFISITSHRLDLAVEMVKSGLFDTMQFPLSSLSTGEDLALSDLCKEHDVGLIAMKAMSGGLIADPTATFALLRGYGNIVPIWGIQHMWELEQFLALEENPPALSPELTAQIEKDKAELAGVFCRGCGYCMPTCPAGINIAINARMSLLLRRMNPDHYTTPAHRAAMEKIKDCTDCGQCREHCPYKLDTPSMLRAEYTHYQQYLKEHSLV